MAIVCVWFPHEGHQGGIDVGHSSLLLDRIRPPVYISWWPKGAVNKDHPSTQGHSVPPYRQDVQLELGNPSRIVSLDCLAETTIAKWWKQAKASGSAFPYARRLQPVSNNYDLWDNNCSTIVLLAMKVGGSEKILPFRAGIVTPLHIWMYASRLKRA